MEKSSTERNENRKWKQITSFQISKTDKKKNVQKKSFIRNIKNEKARITVTNEVMN